MNPIQVSRESIFISAIRSFCNTFFSILGVTICLVIVGFIVTLAMGSASSSEKTAFSIQPDAQGARSPLPITAPALLKITINGIIGSGTLCTSSIENLLLDSREGLLKNDRVKGILLCMDTPGGTVTDSNGIYSALKAYKERYKIPVFAYIDGTCASGGMYILSAADKAYASPISIVGSIGVILGPVFNFSGLMEKWGIQATTIARGKDKAMLNPFAPPKEGDDASLVAISEYLYEHFVSLVTAARLRLNKQELIDVYGAQVYAAPKAQEIGFIDEANGSYERAIHALALAAGIKEEEKYQVIECKTQRPFLSEMLNVNSKFSLVAKIARFFSHETNEQSHHPFLYLYHPKAL
jgi:protease IV